MNGYKMLADSYKQLLEREEPGADKESIEKSIKALEFLATCDDMEICKLFDSSAFNNITKAYCKKAMNNQGFSDEQINGVLDELHGLFSQVNADEIMQ